MLSDLILSHSVFQALSMGIKLSKKSQYNTGETVRCRRSKFASRRHKRKAPNERVVYDIPKQIEVTLAGKTFVLKESGWTQGNYSVCQAPLTTRSLMGHSTIKISAFTNAVEGPKGLKIVIV